MALGEHIFPGPGRQVPSRHRAGMRDRAGRELRKDKIKTHAIEMADHLFRGFWDEPEHPAAQQWRARKSSALTMNMRGSKRGHWYDHKSGEGGDILDFFAVYALGLSKAGEDFKRVLIELGQWLGDPSVAQAEGQKLTQEALLACDRQAQTIEDERKTRKVAAAVAQAQTIADTPAASYLANRGLIPDVPQAFAGYLAPNAELDLPSKDNGSLIVFVRDNNDEIIGVQRIIIDASGRPVSSKGPRKIFLGRMKGGTARLPGSKPRGPLIIAEGPETAIAIWQSTGYETWSVISVAGFLGVNPSLGRQIVLCPDQDAPGSPAAKTFEKAEAQLREQGHDVIVVRAPEPVGSRSDFNDTLLRDGAGRVESCINEPLSRHPRDARGRFVAKRPTNGSPSKRVVNSFLTLDEASTKLREDVSSYVSAALGPRPVGVAPSALVIKASPGTGKSRITREILADLDVGRLVGDIVYYASTLALAEDAARHLQERGCSVQIMRGRTALNPNTGEPMCSRSELTEVFANAGLSVSRNLCASCPMKNSCAYQKQWSDLPKTPVIRIQTTPTLATQGYDRGRPVALRVIDEKFWPSMHHSESVMVDGVVTLLDQLATQRNDLSEIVATIVAVIKSGFSDLAPLKSHDLSSVASAVNQCHRGMISRTASDNDLHHQLEAKQLPLRTAKLTLRLLKILEECQQRLVPFSERARLVQSRSAELIELNWHDPLDVSTPVLLLDADANPKILERFFPDTIWSNINVRPNAHIIQLKDRCLSKESLRSSELQDQVRSIVEHEAHRDANNLKGPKGLLAVASKSVVQQFLNDGGTPSLNGDKIDRGLKCFGATWDWFGPATLGSNAYRDFGTCVVIGREEPSSGALENMTRALFGDHGLNLTFPAEDAPYEDCELEFPLAMADGSTRKVRARGHPDPHARVIQNQIRECGTRQAVERLRLASAVEPKLVILLSNIPIPGLPVDEYLDLDELCPSRLERAKLEAAQGNGCLRLSASGLAKDAPKTFQSESAAASWLKRSGKAEINRVRTGNNKQLCGLPPIFARSVEIRCPGQRGPATPALILHTGNVTDIVRTSYGEEAKVVVDHSDGATEGADVLPVVDIPNSPVEADCLFVAPARFSNLRSMETMRLGFKIPRDLAAMFTRWRMPKFGSHGLTGARGPPQAPQHMSITDNVYAKE